MSRFNPAMLTLAIVAVSAAVLAVLFGIQSSLGTRAAEQGQLEADGPGPEFFTALGYAALVLSGVVIVVGTGWLVAHAIIRHLSILEAGTVAAPKNDERFARAVVSNDDTAASV